MRGVIGVKGTIKAIALSVMSKESFQFYTRGSVLARVVFAKIVKNT